MQPLLAVLQLVTAFLVLGASGYAVALTWRVRGDDAVLAAMPIAWGLIAVTGLLGWVTPIRLTLPAVVLIVLLAAVAGMAAGRLPHHRRHGRPGRALPGSIRPPGPTLLALTAAQVVTLAVFAAATGGNLEIPIQTFDTSSHVNTIRHIAQTGIGDPAHVHLFMINSTTVAGIYPTAFVDTGAVLARLLHVDAVVAANLAAILLAGSLWPSTVAILARAAAGARRTVTVSALATSIGTFGMPWAPMMWGVLWTTAAGAAFAPLLVAGIAGALGMTTRRLAVIPSLALAAAGAVLIALGHPRVLVLVAIPLIAIAAYRLAPSRTRRSTPAQRLAVALALVAVIVVVVVLIQRWKLFSRKVSALPWDFGETVPGTILAHLYGGPAHTGPSQIVAALTLTGVAAVLLRRRLLGWLVAGWLVAVLVDAMTAGARDGWPVNLTSWWYTDRYRSATMTSIFAVPLAAIGATWLVDRLRRRLGTAKARPVSAAAAAVVLASAPVVAVAPLTARYLTSAQDTAAGLVSPAEIEFFAQAAPLIEAQPGIVLNNPQDGSAFFYAYTGLPVAFYHLDQAPATRHGRWLRANLRTGNRGVVCGALRADGIGWVMDLGPTYHNARLGPADAPGMRLPDDFWATRLVLERNQAKLFQVTCR